MALRTLVRRNKNGKIPMTRQRHNLHSFIKQGVNFLSQSTLKTRRISHLFSSALFTIPTAAEWTNYHKKTQLS